MEEALAYNYNIKIESSTKQLILDMIRGIRSVVRSEPDIHTGETVDPVHAERLQQYVREVIVLAEENPDILSGVFNIDELKKYLKYSEDYLEISKQLQELLHTVRKYHEATNHFTVKLANLVREHMDMVEPGEQKTRGRLTMSVIHNDARGSAEDRSFNQDNQALKSSDKDSDLWVVD